MILNSDVTAGQQLVKQQPNQAYVKAYGLFEKIQNMKHSTLTLIVGACIILIVERKIRYKPKEYKFNIKGGK